MKDKGYVIGICASIVFYAAIMGAMFHCCKRIGGEETKKTNNTKNTNKVTQNKHIERDIVSFNIPQILNANDSNIVKFMLDDGWNLIHKHDSLAYGEICGIISDGHKYTFRKEESSFDIDIIE